MQGSDDNGPTPGEGGGELVRVSVDALDHPGLVLELVDGVLELLVQHEPISHHYRVEHFTVVVIVQGSEAGAPARQWN